MSATSFGMALLKGTVSSVKESLDEVVCFQRVRVTHLLKYQQSWETTHRIESGLTPVSSS